MNVWTDGSSSPDGRGGWAWADEFGAFRYGAERNTTNQRMEMTAVLQAVMDHAEPVVIHTDSAYVMNCFVEKWYIKWQRVGWVNGRGNPVVNRDLWEPLIHWVLLREAAFVKVRGHSNDRMNDLVDQMAVKAKGALPRTMRL